MMADFEPVVLRKNKKTATGDKMSADKSGGGYQPILCRNRDTTGCKGHLMWSWCTECDGPFRKCQADGCGCWTANRFAVCRTHMKTHCLTCGFLTAKCACAAKISKVRLCF